MVTGDRQSVAKREMRREAMYLNRSQRLMSRTAARHCAAFGRRGAAPTPASFPHPPPVPDHAPTSAEHLRLAPFLLPLQYRPLINMAGSSSRGLGIANPDLQADANIDALPTYNRGTYQSHPALPGKLQNESQWASSDSHSTSDTADSWADGSARPHSAERAQRILRPLVPLTLAPPRQPSAINVETRIGSAPSLTPQLFPTSPTRSPRPSLTVEIPASPAVSGVYAMQGGAQYGYTGAAVAAYERQQPMQAVQPPHLSVGKDPAVRAHFSPALFLL